MTIQFFLIGALTSKPYAFTARSWELRSVETIDFFDTFASNIRVDTRGVEVMRILPCINNTINEEWISDKIRFSYDGLKKQRLYVPLLRNFVTNKLENSNWKDVFSKLKSFFLKNYNFVFIIGDFLDLETQLLVKLLNNKLGGKIYNQNFNINRVDFRANYLCDQQILENSNCIFLIGLHLRFEFPVLNLKIRRKYNEGAVVASFGYNIEYNYGVMNFGSNIKTLKYFVEGKHLFCKKLVLSTNPLILIGSSFQSRIDAISFFDFFQYFKNFIKNVFYLQNSVSVLNGNELGLYTNKIEFNINSTNKTVYYVINADNIALDVNLKQSNNFIVYQGHNGDRVANIADIVLPSTNPIEKNGKFINLYGDLQLSKFVLAPYGDARVDWKILKAFSDNLGFSFNLNRISDVHATLKRHTILEKLTKNLYIINNDFISKIYNISSYPVIENFYLNDSITRSSSIMSLASKRLLKNQNFII